MHLYQLERDGDTDELAAVIERSESDAVRRRAAELLADLAEDRDAAADDRVVETLVTASAHDENEAVRAAAIQALDEYGLSALERLVAELGDHDTGRGDDSDAKQAFLSVLDADVPELRMAAATGLGRVGDPSVTSSLLDRLDDGDPRVRRRAAEALGRIGDPTAVPALRDRFGDTDPGVRQAAGTALAAVASADALAALEQFATAEHPSLRRNAVDALGRFGGPEPVATLGAALTDDERVVCRTALYSLVELLADAVPHRSHELRTAVAAELRTAPSRVVVPELTELLTEGASGPQRRNAAWLLGRVVADDYRARVLDALFEAVLDAEPTTARVAAASLVTLEASELESRLLDVVDDDTKPTETRSTAVFVLARVGDASTRAQLESVHDRTDDERVGERIVTALTKLRGRNLVIDDE